jgi:hypothetical protein
MVEQRFRPISSSDADRAVDAWESALLGTAEGNQEALEFLVETSAHFGRSWGPGAMAVSPQRPWLPSNASWQERGWTRPTSR